MRDQYSKFPNYIHIQELIIYRYCKTCKQIKPPRAHHCSLCGKCVMRMDHHCPWVGTCVGVKNHKMFLLMMCYAVMSAQFSLKTMGHWNPQKPAYFQNYSDEIKSMEWSLSLCSSMVWCIPILIFQHIFFIFTNSSSIEWGALQGVNPFFLGTRKSELKLYT